MNSFKNYLNESESNSLLRKLIYFVFGLFDHRKQTNPRVTKYNPYTDKW